MRELLSCILVLLCMSYGYAQNSDTLYINQGTYTAIDGNQWAYIALNSTNQFVAQNSVIEAEVGESWQLTIFNFSNDPHGFEIDGLGGIPSINPGESSTATFTFSEETALVYYDPIDRKENSALGLGGIVHVSKPNRIAFYWNIKEQQSDWITDLLVGNSVDWTTYYPDYFTVNGRSHPQINLDPTARVVGSVGDTIHIAIANSGNSDHSIHFHGYHCEILKASQDHKLEGRHKDTIPLKSGNSLLLELVPHQKGEYPVHDHNLVAVSGGGIHPNGMFLTILIE